MLAPYREQIKLKFGNKAWALPYVDRQIFPGFFYKLNMLEIQGFMP